MDSQAALLCRKEKAPFMWSVIDVDIPIFIERGAAGLYYATSPLIPGLLATGQNPNAALDDAERCINNLRKVATLGTAERDLKTLELICRRAASATASTDLMALADAIVGYVQERKRDEVAYQQFKRGK